MVFLIRSLIAALDFASYRFSYMLQVLYKIESNILQKTKELIVPFYNANLVFIRQAAFYGEYKNFQKR